MEAVVPVRKRIIKTVNIPAHLLQELVNEENRILTYMPYEGKTIVTYNSNYRNSLSIKIKNLTEYWIHFQGIRSIKTDIDVYLKQYEELLKNTKEVVSRVSKNLDSEIQEWESKKTSGGIKMNNYLNNQKNGIVDLKTLTERVNFILLNRKNKKSLLIELRKNRDRDSKEAKIFGAIEAESEGPKEILNNLWYFKEIISQNKLKFIEEECDNLLYRYEEVNEYIRVTKSAQISIDNIELISMDRINKYKNIVLEFFEEFCRTYQELSNIHMEFVLRDKCLQMIKEKWKKHEEYNYCKALNEFVGAEMEFWKSKKDNGEFRAVFYETVDRSEHLKETFKNIQENMQSLNNDISSCMLLGDIHYNTEEVAIPCHCGRDSSRTYTLFRNINHSICLQKNVSKKHFLNPEEYNESLRTTEKKKLMIESNKNFESIQEVYAKNLIKVEEYEKLLKEINQNLDQIDSKNMELFQEFSSKQANFLKFFNKKKNKKRFNIRKDLNNALIGIILRRVNIRLRPGCCSCKPRLFKTTNLNPADLYSIFLTVLQNSGKKVAGFFRRSKVDRVHSCEKIALDDIRTLLLEPEVLVSLKASNGHEQILKEEVLREDCLYSISKIIKNSAKLMSFYRNLKLKLAKTRTEHFIIKYQKYLSDVLIENNYLKLEVNTRKANYEF